MKKFSELTNELTLVDFFATWCGPCKMIAPVLEELENIDVIKVDVDEERELAIKYQISSVPTLMLMKDKEVVSTKLGYHSLEELNEWINQFK